MRSLDPLSPLVSPRSETGFRSVYRHRKFTRCPYCARVRIGGLYVFIGRAETPHKAAELVAAWYRNNFGESWPAVVRARKRNPWELIWSRKASCYKLIAWVFGKPTLLELPPILQSEPPPPGTRLTRYTAEWRRHWSELGSICALYVEAWTVANFGLFAPFVLWRTDGELTASPGSVWWQPPLRIARPEPERRQAKSKPPHPTLPKIPGRFTTNARK